MARSPAPCRRNEVTDGRFRAALVVASLAALCFALPAGAQQQAKSDTTPRALSLEYKLEVEHADGGTDWVLDPANPRARPWDRPSCRRRASLPAPAEASGSAAACPSPPPGRRRPPRWSGPRRPAPAPPRFPAGCAPSEWEDGLACRRRARDATGARAAPPRRWRQRRRSRWALVGRAAHPARSAPAAARPGRASGASAPAPSRARSGAPPGSSRPAGASRPASPHPG